MAAVFLVGINGARSINDSLKMLNQNSAREIIIQKMRNFCGIISKMNELKSEALISEKRWSS
jgi:hypothetical protein